MRNIIIILILSTTSVHASEEKESILELLEKNSVILEQAENNCLNSANTPNNKYKACGIAALIAMEYSSYIGALSLISENEVNNMLDLYIEKHGKDKMINNQKIINTGAKTSNKILKVYKSMLLN